MDYQAVIDISSLIWDQDDYYARTNEYYELKDSILSFMEKFQKEQPYIVLRDELIYQILAEFPYRMMPEQFYDFGSRISNFLLNIRPEKIVNILEEDNCINSFPNIIKHHFSEEIKTEINYILTHIHENNQHSSTYFTFQTLWNNSNKLKTILDKKEVEYNVIICDTNKNLDSFFELYEKKFDHNPKHDRIKKVAGESPLSCYDGIDASIPQSLLDTSIRLKRRFFNYDKLNNVYVVFYHHQGNKYHGHDLTYDIPAEIKRHFNK